MTHHYGSLRKHVSLYQDVATGTLVVVAVGIDKVLRRGGTR